MLCISTFSNQLNCYVAVLVGILFGTTVNHYERYFLSLLGCDKYSNFDDFKNDWPGNVCNFSDAERVGFNKAVQNHFLLSDHELRVEDFYYTCEVHFRNSLGCVAWNLRVVPFKH